MLIYCSEESIVLVMIRAEHTWPEKDNYYLPGCRYAPEICPQCVTLWSAPCSTKVWTTACWLHI